MKPVAPNELEVSLFGPGYGESLVIHLGANQWIIVDSCRNPVTRRAAPLEYLENLGVDPATAVQMVIATHWHDDHIRGLGEIVRACASAEFVCAAALTEREFITMVNRYEARNKIASGSGVREMYDVLHCLAERKRQPRFAAPNRLVYRCVAAETVAGGRCEIITLSPADKQVLLFWGQIANQLPKAKQPKRRVVSRTPNHVAVVLWVSAGQEHLLLGSDLEETADPETGWSVIVSSAERPRGAAVVFKIAHHGSETAHSDDVWKHMVGKDAYAILTPFRKGNVSLPTPEDVGRITGLAGVAYLTAPADSGGFVRRPDVVRRQIRQTVGKLRLAEPGLGHVRMRKRYAPGARWYVSLIGAARLLKQTGAPMSPPAPRPSRSRSRSRRSRR